MGRCNRKHSQDNIIWLINWEIRHFDFRAHIFTELCEQHTYLGHICVTSFNFELKSTNLLTTLQKLPVRQLTTAVIGIGTLGILLTENMWGLDSQHLIDSEMYQSSSGLGGAIRPHRDRVTR